MTSPQQKILQYLNEAHATELALTRVLQSQIAMTPRGSYRSALESHLIQTRDHADRVARRLKALGQGENPLQAIVGLAETVVGQVLALGKTPLDLLRGSGGEEKVLKNAKDTAATEALEIATYTRARARRPRRRRRRDRDAGGLDPRRRGEDARARPARGPEARGRRRARRRRRRSLLRPRHHRCRRGRQARDQRRPAVARLRRAHRRRGRRRRCRRATTTSPRRCAATSAPTRTAPACSRPPGRQHANA